MPPPTRMNIANSAAPKPKPSSTVGAFSLNHSSTTEAPNRPRPTVSMPQKPPVRNAIRMASRLPVAWAAAATRTLPRVASVMPKYPTSAEKQAPTTKNTDGRSVRWPHPR